MVNKVIEFVVSADGEISPKVEQSAGVQGNHNVTQVDFDVSALNYDFAATNIRTRIQFIDGAGGFESTGFLDVVSDGDKKIVSALVPRCITNAGGVTKVHLVVTEISYNGNVANEDEVFLSGSGKIRFESSGVGSPSNDMYLKGISSALVNAETFVGLAETASDNAEQAKNDAEGFKNDAATAATSAASSAASAASDLQALKDGIANGNFKGEPGPQGPQGDKGEPGETPSLDGVIQFWQPNIEYKVGDVVIANLQEVLVFEDNLYHPDYPYRTVIAKCVRQHTSTNFFDLNNNAFELTWEILQETKAYYDALGRGIHNTYATKEEIVGTLGTINEVLATLVEVE